jgi:flavin reductase
VGEPSPTTWDPPADASFRAVLGRFATGVAVMTTLAGGEPHGMTANAITSVSLEPPLVLVCVERATTMARRVTAGGIFALTFLAADQADLSARFADPERPDGREQFDGLTTATAATGAPVLVGGVGWVDCRVWAVHDGGDHLIVVGEVVALEGGEGEPLLYYRSGYGAFAPTDEDG